MWQRAQLLFSFLFIITGVVCTENSLAQDNNNAYINVGQAGVKKSLAAITPIQFMGTPSLAKSYVKYQKDLQDIIEKDFTVVSYFTLQDPSSFLEDSNKGLRPAPVDSNGFDYKSWASINTEFLIKTGFNVIGDKMTLDAYVYDVARKELLFGRSYNAPLKDLRSVGHTFCNDVIQKLSGKKAFFLTKFVVSRTTGKGSSEIFMMDWDGANQKQITSSQSIAVSPSWSPNGQLISYSIFNYHQRLKARNADLYVYDLKTQKGTILSAVKGLNTTASFMPDMSGAIIRISPSNGTSDLYKVSFNGGKKQQITYGPRGAMNVEPAVSPDGTKMAFSSDRSGKAMIYIHDFATQKDTRVSFAGHYNSSPAWSPDGSKLAFAGHVDNHFDIYVMDSSGKNLQKITSAKKTSGRSANNEDPSFSPDGRMILYRSDRTGNYQLYATTVDGKSDYRLTFDKQTYTRPQWSPFLQ
ncbi:MAG: PD40 domain-containing protein [Bdellovibrionaceae bacterium]|nr:PD40 domain-containing protein [Pseudobdellovibrionaceae bacterium]